MADNHALLVLAADIASAPLPPVLKQEGADVRHLETDSFGIDDARRLTELSAERSFAGDEHYFIISARSLTAEAQNAILKLFEDPPVGTVFYLIVPSESVLLPTLRSRLLRTGASAPLTNHYADDFCRANYKERMEWIADKNKKDPTALIELVRELAQVGRQTDWPIEAKRALSLALRYVYNRGAAKKMLVEELALSLPVGR